MSFIAQAKGLRLRAVVEFASLKVYREVTPSLQFIDNLGSENSNLLKLSENTSRKTEKSKHRQKAFARRRINYGGKRRLLLSHRRSVLWRERAIGGGNQRLLLTQA